MARRSLLAAIVLMALLPVAVARAATRARFSAPIQAYVESVPFRVAAADLNGDRIPDLATADNRARVASVLLGRGDGSLRPSVSFPTAGRPADIATADLSGDGRVDLVTVSDNRRGSVTVLLNRGAGRFRRAGVYSSGAVAPAVATADLNHDGRIDILTANLGRLDLGVLLGIGGGRFGPVRRFAGGYGVIDSDVGDLNGDGNVDVALATGNYGDAVVVMLGAGDGTFGPPRQYPAGDDPVGVAIADVTDDARPDLVVARHSGDGNVSVFPGRGDGTFDAATTTPMAVGAEYVVVADFDADGHPDIATSSLLDAPAVAGGHGDGSFEPARDLGWIYYQGGAVADFNRDGRPDLAFAASDYAEANIYLNWTGAAAPPCVVLELRGLRLRTARRDLRDGSCRLGRIHRRSSRKVRRNRVIALRVPVGSVHPSGTRIDLIVSRGRRR
jgi:hypothetical protein